VVLKRHSIINLLNNRFKKFFEQQNNINMAFQKFSHFFSMAFLTILTVLTLNAQVPQVINYQAVVRDGAGEIVKNKAVNFRLSILDNGPSGTPQYIETQNKTTNQFGLVTFGIGQGTTVSGSMNAVTWSTGNKFFKVELDINGGNNFSVMSTSQFLSVPYALYAANGGSVAVGWGLNGNTATSTDKLGTNNTQDLRFVTEGAQKMVLKPSGFLGLGTPNPEARLTVEGIGDGTSAVEDRIFAKFNNKSTGFASVASLEMLAGVGSGSTMLSHHAPSYTVNTDFGDYGQLWSSGRGLIIRASAGSAANDKQGNIRFYTGFNSSTSEFVNNNERMRITNNGYIGIGTKNPPSKLSIAADANGFTSSSEPEGRILIDVRNVSTSTASQAIMRITAGNGGNFTNLAHSASTYTVGSDTDSGVLWSSGTGGLVLRASPKSSSDPDVNAIRFQTGWNPGALNVTYDRMILDKNGYLGIGTMTPKAKLEVTDGDVYVNDATKGIILKSPNGNCWRVTVDNTGNFVRTAISCPN
jgi:hypothetical protein